MLNSNVTYTCCSLTDITSTADSYLTAAVIAKDDEYDTACYNANQSEVKSCRYEDTSPS